MLCNGGYNTSELFHSITALAGLKTMIVTGEKNREIEYGDYQTPESFTDSVCSMLKRVYGLMPTVIIEPTFGTGNFINSAISEFETVNSIYGIEIDEDYFSLLNDNLSNVERTVNLELFNADVFSFDFSDIKDSISNDDLVLILGNPPWATNSKLSSFRSYNLPLKGNIKGYSGLDAITGKGNFDIAEYIILQMLSEFSRYDCVLAMLCKTIVAKNIIRDIQKFDFNIAVADMFVFDAKYVFNVNCDAALFVVKLGKQSTAMCNVYDYNTLRKIRRFGWENGLFLSDISDKVMSSIGGVCQLEWRQGVKHDCSKIMELKKTAKDEFQNSLGDTIFFSLGRYVFPLLKSSDIKFSEINETRRFVIVTQQKANDDTSKIEFEDKKVWDYLVKYSDLLNARKSIIYKKAPRFSMFGVGEYSFSKYKVGISGFYKEPTFALISGDFPIMLDDTCYFLSFDNLSDAIIATALLNSPVCNTFLKSIAFIDSKRPYTKEVLKQIDLLKLSEIVQYDYVRKFAETMKGMYVISKQHFKEFQNKISSVEGSL
jgi:16S rRNA A1518/A1519 N6-dimethyltransferase RsmA/KsgA/DIM1 with predicted DNA glycosylase/AP lyase activity